MNAFQRKITWRVLGIHVAVIVVVMLSSAMRGCFRPKPRPEIVTFIEFGSPAPQVSLEPVSEMSEPEPQAPAPEPEPAPIPEPTKPKPRPKPIPKPKPKPKPKWKPTSPKDIKIGKKVDDTPSKPRVSDADIKKALSGISSSMPSGATGNPSQFNSYYGRVMSLFYNYWKPPASGSSAGSTVVRIYMQKNGRITKMKKIRSSGSAVYDKTVMNAVNAVSTLPRPPSNYPYDYVEVVFTQEN